MERLIGVYGRIMESTNPVWAADNIEYRQFPADGSKVIAVDHKHGVVIRTDFSDYHEMVQKEIEYHIARDKYEADLADAHAERNHP